MNDSLKNSLDKLRLIEDAAGDVRDVAGTATAGGFATKVGGNLLNKAGVATAGKIAGKAARFVPYAGAAYSAADAVNRAQLGDTTGAALSGAGALPFIGIPAIAAQAIRDKYKTGSWFPDDEEIAKAYGTSTQPPVKTQPKTTPDAQPATVPTTKLKFDPKVKAIQDKILAKDPNALPKYGADGKLGQETQTAMKRLGITAESQNKGIAMHDSTKLKELKSRLNHLEENNQQLDEIIGPLARLASKVGGKLLARKAAARATQRAAGGIAGTAAKSNFNAAARQAARNAQNLSRSQRIAAAKALRIAARSPAGAAKVLDAAKNIPWLKTALTAAGLIYAGITAYDLYKSLTTPEEPKEPLGSLIDGPMTPPGGAPPAQPQPDEKPSGAADDAKVASTDPTDVLGQDAKEKSFNSGELQGLMQKAIDELNSLAKDLESEKDPMSISLLGEYNGLLKRLEKAGFKPNTALAESLEEVHKRLVIARSRKI